ncbi:MAG: hypothetical protein ACTHWZ_07745 [Peptoniphilaceae bacterium]
MEIVRSCINIINYDQNKIEERDISEGFNNYIEELVSYFKSNESTRGYKSRSLNTEVVSSVLGIVKNQDEFDNLNKNISRRLLEEEIKVQEKISSMGVSVQKGSLIQAVLIDDIDEYIYVIAKVEHEEFVDDKDYSFKSGFSKDKQKIWKTCIFESINQNASFIDSKIFLNNVAKYWTDDFLELDEIRNDEINTRNAFKSVDALLKRDVKKYSEGDYFVLKNSLVGELKKEVLVDYPEVVKNLVTGYRPYNENIDINKLKDSLLELPKTHNFDKQFNSVPDSFKKASERIFKVNDNIELKIKGHIDTNKISTEREADGRLYVKIETDNKNLINIFDN